MIVKAWGSWELFQALLVVLKSIANQHGKSIANIATRWVLDHPFVGAVIIGTAFTTIYCNAVRLCSELYRSTPRTFRASRRESPRIWLPPDRTWQRSHRSYSWPFKRAYYHYFNRWLWGWISLDMTARNYVFGIVWVDRLFNFWAVAIFRDCMPFYWLPRFNEALWDRPYENGMLYSQ